MKRKEHGISDSEVDWNVILEYIHDQGVWDGLNGGSWFDVGPGWPTGKRSNEPFQLGSCLNITQNPGRASAVTINELEDGLFGL